MYMTIREYTTSPEKINEIMSLIQDNFVPFLSKEPGFYSLFAVDTGRGRLILISVFEEVEARSKSTIARIGSTEYLSEFLLHPPKITIGDVQVHEVA